MNPKISVFTPSHNPLWLPDLYRSLQKQDFKEWEWVVLLNGDADEPSIRKNARTKIIDERGQYYLGVGEVKKRAVEHCEAPILVEVDHDDLLMPDCLSEVYRSFQDHPEASLVYSQFTQMNWDGKPDSEKFREDYGWTYETTEDGYIVPRELKPTPHNVSLIWYAPNHVRAFTREAYDKTEGYDASLRVLDDQDIMTKLYRVGEFISIPKMLYKQRMFNFNTQKHSETNDLIQVKTREMYAANIAENAIAWSRRNGSEVLSRTSSRMHLDDLRENQFGYADLPVGIAFKDIVNIHHAMVPNGIVHLNFPEDAYMNEHLVRAFTGSDNAQFQESRILTYLDENGKKRVDANLITVKEGYTRDGGPLYNLSYL